MAGSGVQSGANKVGSGVQSGANVVGSGVQQGAGSVAQAGASSVASGVQVASPAVQQGGQVESSTVSRVIEPAVAQGGKRSIGREGMDSLNKIINSMRSQMPRSAQLSIDEGQSYVDPQSESKLLAHKQQLIDQVLKLHPRFNAAFHQVSISGNVITVEAPTIALESDLNNSRAEICEIIAGVAGVEGQLELKVVLNEVEVKLLPVKIEDRYQFIEDINPEGVKFFIEKFDLTL